MIVRHGETGFLLPPDAGGIDDAQIIYKIYQDEYRYQELVCNSRKAYDEGLNWDNWGGKWRLLWPGTTPTVDTTDSDQRFEINAYLTDYATTTIPAGQRWPDGYF